MAAICLKGSGMTTGAFGTCFAIPSAQSSDWKSPSETDKRPQPLESQPLRGLVTFSRGFQSLDTMADNEPNDPLVFG